MSRFSLEWFKQEHARLQLEEQQIKNELLKLEMEEKRKEMLEDEEEGEDCDCCDDDYDDYYQNEYGDQNDYEEDDYVPYVKPYMHLKMVNDVLTIVLNDGQIISKPNATQDDFKAAQNATSEADLFTLVMSQEVKDDKMRLQINSSESSSNVSSLNVSLLSKKQSKQHSIFSFCNRICMCFKKKKAYDEIEETSTK